MSRRELLDDFLNFVTEPGDATSRDIAERLYNRALMTLWRKHPWRQFRMPTPIQITLQAGQRSYVLPDYFGRVAGGRIRNISVPCDIVGMEPEMLQTLHPEAGTTEETAGSPDLYTVSGTCGVEAILPAPRLLDVSSTSGLEGTVVTWTVEGFDANRRWRRATGSTNGPIAVTVTDDGGVPLALIPWTFSKSYKAGNTPTTDLTSSQGTIVLNTHFTGLDDVIVLAQLPPYQSAAEHQVITFYPVPDSSGDTVVVPYLRRPVRELNDGDVVPMDWTEALMEEMVLQWRVNTGELSADSASNAARPKFLDLLAWETGNRFGYPSRTRPFIG